MTAVPPARAPQRLQPGQPLLLSAVILLLGSLALGLLPVAGLSSVWEFRQPGQETQDLVLVSEPRELTFATTGQSVLEALAGAQQPVTIFETGTPDAFGALRLEGLRGEIYVEFAGVEIPGLRFGVLPAGPVELAYSGAEVSLQSGFDEASVAIEDVFPALPSHVARQVHVAGPTMHQSVVDTAELRIAAPPSTLQWPMWRWLLVIALIVAFVSPNALGRALVRGFASSSAKRVSRSDLLIAAVGVLTLFLNPPLPDDNWVLTTNRQYPEVGFFSNYYTANAAPQPQGYWWSLIEHIWLGQYWLPVFWSRVASVLLIVLAWWLLRRLVLDPVLPRAARRPAYAVGVFVMLAMLLAWTPTLRPEPVVVVLSVVALVFALAVWRTGELLNLQLVGGAAALAFSVHQSGVIVVGVFVGCVLAWGYMGRREPTVRGRLVSLTGTVIGLTVTLLMLGSNFQVARWSAKSFSTEGLHDAMLDEIRRFDGLAEPTIVAVRLLAALLVYGCAFAYAASPRGRRLTDRDYLALVAAAGLLSLVLTSSKWPWHLGAAAGLVVVVMVMGVGNALARKTGGRRYLLALGAGLTLLLAVTFAHRYETGRLDLLNISMSALTHAPLFRLVFGPWTVLLIGAVVIIWTIRRQRVRAGFLSLMIVLAGLVTARTFLPVVVDEFSESEQSWPAVMATSAAGQACGILDSQGMEVPTRLEPLKVAAPTAVAVPARLVDPGAQGPRWKPPAPTAVWKSLGPGSTGTAWYTVSAGLQTRVYFQEQPGRASVVVGFADDSGRDISSLPVNRTATAPVWGFVDVAVPAGATRMAVFWNSWDGPLAVQGPVVVSAKQPVTQVLGGGPLWTNPASGLWGPCIRMPSIANGSFEPFSWALDYPKAGFDVALWTDLASISEQACRDLTDGDRLCIYKVDRYFPPVMPTQRPAEKWGRDG